MTPNNKTLNKKWSPKRLQSLKRWPSSSSTMMSFICLSFVSLNLFNLALCNLNNSENIHKFSNESLINETNDSCDESPVMVWSRLLEDYVVSQSSNNHRLSKDLPIMMENGEAVRFVGQMNPPTTGQQNYYSPAYRQRQGGTVYITKRIGETVELEPHMRPPIEIVNSQFRPMTISQQQQQQHQQQQQQRQQPGFFQQLFGFGGGGPVSSPISPALQQQQAPLKPTPMQQQLHGTQQQPFRAVSENDLYLLGAIEKLVYRVDYLESRLRRAEQLIYYLMAGNDQKEVRDPCPSNFSRINEACYYINGNQQVNWKTANSACKALNSHLAEFEKPSENEEVIAYLLNQQNYRGKDYWLGGLNPGLLWIWSNSAKPVNPDMNLTSIAMSHEHGAVPNDNDNNLFDSDDDEKGNKKKEKPSANETVLNSSVEIKGQGRCLRLTYDSGKHSYQYYGQECTSRHFYICKHEDKTLDNKIKKITRELKLN